jgi:PAS domain S-box-containing protein
MSTDHVPELENPLLVFERMDEAYYATDREFHVLIVNRRAEAFWGLPRSELVGRSMLELFPAFAGSPPHAAHVEALRTGKPVAVETVSTATGSPVSIRVFPSVAGLSVYFQDVTRRRTLEREIKTRDELLGLAELSAGIGVWEQDLTTGTMTGTPQYFRLLGVEPPDGAVSQEFVRAFRHPDDGDRVVQSFREAMARGAETFETEYRITRPSGEVRWIFGRGRVTRDGRGMPIRNAGVDIDITARKQQEEHLHVVVGELLHRTNNLLAVVQGMAQQTARHSETLGAFVPTFSARLQGLSQSSVLLAREEWRGADLRELIRAQVTPFAEASRFTFEGPTVRLSPKAVQNVGLALHELCTNAIKYGALQLATGHVVVRWSIEDGALQLSWTEHGGPAVAAPRRKGFGRVVSEQALASALDATVRTDFAPDGIVWNAVLPPEHFTVVIEGAA